MSLDVYVGSLTRYYTREWQTIAQQQNPNVQVVRRNDPPDRVTSPAEIMSAVLNWQEAVARAIDQPVTWNESNEAPYYTDTPSWAGLGALVLWAVYDQEHTPLDDRRSTVSEQDWSDDPVLQRVRSGQSKPAEPSETEADVADVSPPGPRPLREYSSLVLQEEMWLPIDGQVVFQGPDPAGNTRMISTCEGLMLSLNTLNMRTWRVGVQQRDEWLRREPADGSELLPLAQYAWAVMHTLTEQAIAARLPILLDY